MYVKRVCYPIQVLGPGKRLGIWLAGCNKRCPGCMSPELQTTEGSKNIPVKEIEKMFAKVTDRIDGITISGGEPFLQAEELHELVEYVRQNITEDIIIFSGYKIEELKQMNSVFINEILASISVLIDGEYVDELNDGIGMRGSSNQRVHIFRECKDYSELLAGERKLQTFRYNGQILVVGIQ